VIKAGDYVLLQFGHNDPGQIGEGKDRAIDSDRAGP